MSIIDEATGTTNLHTALDVGVQNLARNQSVTFRQYTRKVLALDGYVFWVPTNNDTTAYGVVHIGVERHQDEDQTIGVNSVIFTSTTEVTEFNTIEPGEMWIASFDAPGGQSLEIAFSRRGPYQASADLYHYAGFAVFPPLKTQVITATNKLPTDPIVNNSLPIWLALDQYAPVFPSFLIPDNIVPPYISAHIEPGHTSAIQGFMDYEWSTATPDPGKPGFYELTSQQLMHDHVRLTLYGFNNQQSLQYLSYLLTHSLLSDDFGFMSSPALNDDKRTQPEIAAIAMKKTLEFDVSYYQSTVAATASRLITSATMAISA